MAYEDIQTTIMTLLSFAGGITVIVGAISGVIKLIDYINKNKANKQQSMEKVISDHTNEIASIKNDVKGLQTDIKESKEMTILIFKGVKSLLDNAISGQNADDLKKSRKELDTYLIEKNK